MHEWAGGSEAFERLTDVFYDLVRGDDLIGCCSRTWTRAYPRYVAMWLAEGLGGPDSIHVNAAVIRTCSLTISVRESPSPSADARRWNLLMDAADGWNLPADPEFRAAFAGYIEWEPGWP